jgi:hypothetical protein
MPKSLMIYILGVMSACLTIPAAAQIKNDLQTPSVVNETQTAVTVYDDKISVIGDARDVEGKLSQLHMKPFVEGMRQSLIGPIRTHYVHKDSKPFMGTAYGLIKPGQRARFWLETEEGLSNAQKDEIMAGFKALNPPKTSGKTDLIIIYFRAWNAPMPDAYPLLLPVEWQGFVKTEAQLGRPSTLAKIWPGK